MSQYFKKQVFRMAHLSALQGYNMHLALRALAIPVAGLVIFRGFIYPDQSAQTLDQILSSQPGIATEEELNQAGSIASLSGARNKQGVSLTGFCTMGSFCEWNTLGFGYKCEYTGADS